MEEAVLEVREKHATWGGRKIKARLQTLGWQDVPAASTITEILRRHGCIDPEESGKHKAWNRFEAEAPNVLWQMDFKGHFEAAEGRCHPLTVLDDHSRYSLGLQACADEKGDTVPRASGLDLSAVWFAAEDFGGQWVALGVGWRPSLYASDGLVDAAGDPGVAQSAVSSPDPR
jgi:transposase InsO family protein